MTDKWKDDGSGMISTRRNIAKARTVVISLALPIELNQTLVERSKAMNISKSFDASNLIAKGLAAEAAEKE